MNEIIKLIQDILSCEGTWFEMMIDEDFAILLREDLRQLQAYKDKEDKITKKYKEYADNIFSNMSFMNDITEQNMLKYDKDICRVWTKFNCYQDFIQDLKILNEGSDK